MKIPPFIQEQSPSAARRERSDSSGTVAGDGARRAEESAGEKIAAARQELNRSIMSKTMEATVSAGNQPLALLLRTAIDNINAALAPELGPNAIQEAYDSGLDVSPEATAGRIVSMSTAFFDLYREQHPGKEMEAALDDFVKLIAGGIDRGFAEARQLLGGLGVLQGDIAANIDRTYELVQEGLRAFTEGRLNSTGTE